jgi:hypothetical protein
MSEVLSEAYDNALNTAKEQYGPEVANVVRLTIESKHRLTIFEETVQTYGLTEEQLRYIVGSYTEEITSGVAMACSLLRMGFRKDIMPIVETVTQSATQLKNLQ